MPTHELIAPPPPAQPVVPSKAVLHYAFFCVLGPRAGAEHVAIFDELRPMLNRIPEVHHRDRVNGAYQYNDSRIFIPIDPFTVVRLGVATWAELGYPEVADAYSKLMSLS